MSRRKLVPLMLATTLAACGANAKDDSSRASVPSSEGTAAPTATAARVRLARVGNFDSPLYVTAPAGDQHRLFVVEKTGSIRIVKDGRTLPAPFLDLSDQVSSSGEQGLLSMAFAPDYASSGRFYVDYTDRSGNSRIVEFHRSGDPDRADRSSARLVLFQRQPEENHNGGLVLFGPDKLLYIGFGDGGGADDQHGRRGNAQNLGTLLGKLLRIDPRRSGRRAYTIPRSNPLVHRRGARGEIYSYGLRNPWRFSFDRSTGDITIGDVGQDAAEEVDFARRGRARGVNYGWRVFEGNKRNYGSERAPNAVRPVLTYATHRGGTCSVTGGYVVRDRALGSLFGQYVYGDFCVGALKAVSLRAGSARGNHSLGLHVSDLSSFGEDAMGKVYATSLSGPVYRLVAG